MKKLPMMKPPKMSKVISPKAASRIRAKAEMKMKAPGAAY